MEIGKYQKFISVFPFCNITILNNENEKQHNENNSILN